MMKVNKEFVKAVALDTVMWGGLFAMYYVTGRKHGRRKAMRDFAEKLALKWQTMRDEGTMSPDSVSKSVVDTVNEVAGKTIIE